MNIEVEHARKVDEPIGIVEVIPGVGLPKALFFLAAFLSFGLSVSLFFNGDREQGIFVGLWVPSILSAGNLLLGRNGHE